MRADEGGKIYSSQDTRKAREWLGEQDGLKKYSVERTSRLLGLTWGRAPGIGQRAPVAFMTPSPKGDEKFRNTFSLNYSLRIWDT